jgi:hypothetical protein
MISLDPGSGKWIAHRERPRRGYDQRVHRNRVTLVTLRGPKPGPSLPAK